MAIDMIHRYDMPFENTWNMLTIQHKASMHGLWSCVYTCSINSNFFTHTQLCFVVTKLHHFMLMWHEFYWRNDLDTTNYINFLGNSCLIKIYGIRKYCYCYDTHYCAFCHMEIQYCTILLSCGYALYMTS